MTKDPKVFMASFRDFFQVANLLSYLFFYCSGPKFKGEKSVKGGKQLEGGGAPCSSIEESQ